ncbi:hypothetical protein ABZ362_28380 [Streptomyces sp. NPDC005951]|uniref:hypothetical protein n=1 Tax=Streptomyces sp. NPDC005951 TaxID=3154573 RepID=UPI003404A31F
MSFKKNLAVLVGAIGVVASLASPAQASETGYWNQHSPEACKSQSASDFKFAIYFNSNYGGSHRNIGYSVWDFADESPGGSPQGGTHPLRFCPGGNGGNQGIKNNAASAKNKHSTYYAVVYYNSGYKGNADWIGWKNNWSKLANTYNENASFAWQSL